MTTLEGASYVRAPYRAPGSFGRGWPARIRAMRGSTGTIQRVAGERRRIAALAFVSPSALESLVVPQHLPEALVLAEIEGPIRPLSKPGNDDRPTVGEPRIHCGRRAECAQAGLMDRRSKKLRASKSGVAYDSNTLPCRFVASRFRYNLGEIPRRRVRFRPASRPRSI